jgi:hypothetical protein
LFSLGSVEHVPFSYIQKANKQWWKYLIPQFFPAYSPMEIEEWSADVIMEHLAACGEIKRQNKGGEN